MEVDRIFVEIFEERGGNLCQLGFGITVGCRRISVDGAEISLTKNQRVAHRPVLGETDESVIHGKVAVRVVLAHYFADDAGAFARGAIRIEAHLLHRVENAAMHGLESVANVGQRAADDDRHRIIEIRPAHLLFDVDGLNVQRTGATTIATRRRSQGEFWILIVRHMSNELRAVSYELNRVPIKRAFQSRY